ncbi:MAG: hypothetical protein RJA10_2215 [Pseudomonadota bacterium]|jgi:hypothetical protein
MTLPWHQRFSTTYAQARQRFLAAAAARGLAVETHVLPLPGVKGETLAMDVVLDGEPDAPHLVMTTSACHGIEGYCGSALQTGLLQGGGGVAPAGGGVAVLHVHALNPHGFSHGRRVTQENVDLNRNFIDFSQPLPTNPGYERIHALLLPPAWPPTAEVEAALAVFRTEAGPRGWQAAVSQGQYGQPGGMYFGGQAPTWSNAVFRDVLRRHVAPRRHLAWIDLHTGLGPRGVGERIFASIDEGAALARARAWWGPAVTSVTAGTSNSIPLTGVLQFALADECPGLEHTNVCLEFGTVPLPEMFEALRADHWLHLNPQADAPLAAAIRARIRQAFYPDGDDWRAEVWRQGLQVHAQAVAGLQGLPR